MVRPAVHPTTDELFASIGSGFTATDEANGWHLLMFLDAGVGGLAAIDDIVRDTEDSVGWRSVLDVDRASFRHLPWLAQFVGVRFRTDDDTELKRRNRIRNREGFYRGTVDTIRSAIQAHLVGGKQVTLVERDTSAYHFHVETFEIETPDADAVEAEIRQQKPAGLQFTYVVVPGDDWANIKSDFPTWNDVKLTLATWDDVRTYIG